MSDDYYVEIKEKSLKIQFKDVTDIDLALDYLKDGEELPCQIGITVWEKGTPIARY